MAIDRYDYLYASVSGLRPDACAVLGHRWDGDESFSARRTESWVVTVSPDVRPERLRPQLERGRAAWFTRLWRAPSGRLYVTDSAGVLHVREPDPPGTRRLAREMWREFPLPAALMGVWGLDDACVFVWGGSAERERLFQWNGTAWLELPSPGRIVAMHGVSPDHVYAVGHQGTLAFWGGHRWDSFVTPTTEALSGVWADAETAYACGQGGTLLEGSRWGWQVIARHARPLHGVVRWNDRLWIAAGRDGLLARTGRSDRLEAVRSDLVATSLDAREQLLIAGGCLVHTSSDGSSFHPVAAHALTRARSGQAPLWEAS